VTGLATQLPTSHNSLDRQGNWPPVVTSATLATQFRAIAQQERRQIVQTILLVALGLLVAFTSTSFFGSLLVDTLGLQALFTTGAS
jgi:hypothetical protein